jgi:peptide/nickel transport system permease protein
MKLLIRRFSLYLITAWVAITANFLLPRLMPGNPIEQLIAKLQGRVTPQMIRAIKLQFGQGLNQPLVVQYWHYVTGLAHGQLGESITLSQPVSQILGGQIWWTIGLIGTAAILSFLIGTTLGVLFGWTRGSRLDVVIPAATFLQSLPYYFLGTILIMYFAGHLHWFPIMNAYDPAQTPGWSWSYIASVLRYGELPILSIVLSSLAGWMLGMRNMMVTTISEDFVLMAVAKGLPRRKVMWHAARNAVLPSVANLALTIGFLVSGSLLVEQVFNYPGVGNLLVNAVGNEDYPLLQGIFLLVTLTVLGANFLADALYYILDPRTRSSRHQQ